MKDLNIELILNEMILKVKEADNLLQIRSMLEINHQNIPKE